MDKKIKNIIFDLNGVIFEYSTKSEFISLDNGTIIHPIQPIESGVKILEKLKNKKNSAASQIYKLFACTNWKNSVIELLKSKYKDVINFFDAVITPDISNAKKPDHRMFKYLIDKYELIPSQCLFLDDQLQNVQSAQDFDMSAIHINDINSAWPKIQEILLKNK